MEQSEKIFTDYEIQKAHECINRNEKISNILNIHVKKVYDKYIDIIEKSKSKEKEGLLRLINGEKSYFIYNAKIKVILLDFGNNIDELKVLESIPIHKLEDFKITNTYNAFLSYTECNGLPPKLSSRDKFYNDFKKKYFDLKFEDIVEY